MTDLTDLTAALSIKVIGSDLTGQETYPLNVDANGEGRSKDALNVGGVNGAISVSTTATEAKVGISQFANRKLLTFIPTTGTIYYGFSNAVTIASGTPIYKNQLCILAVSGVVSVWLIAANATDVRITEGA